MLRFALVAVGIVIDVESSFLLLGPREGWMDAAHGDAPVFAFAFWLLIGTGVLLIGLIALLWLWISGVVVRRRLRAP